MGQLAVTSEHARLDPAEPALPPRAVPPPAP